MLAENSRLTGLVGYAAAMLRSLVGRSFALVCLLLFAYALVKVPIGRRTGWGHLVAIFSTRPAHEAAEDVKKAGSELGERMLSGRPDGVGKAGRH